MSLSEQQPSDPLAWIEFNTLCGSAWEPLPRCSIGEPLVSELMEINVLLN